MATKEIQALLLEQPKDSKFVVKFEQNTDWISVGAIILSLLAFVITIIIVRSTTKAQIASNIQLINSQNSLKIKELKILQRSKELEELHGAIENYISSGVALQHFYELSHAYSKYGNIVKEDKKYFKEQLATNKIKFRIATYNLFTYLNIHDETHQKIHVRMLDFISVVVSMVENEENSEKYKKKLEKYIQEFQYIHAILKTYLQEEYKSNKGE